MEDAKQKPKGSQSPKKMTKGPSAPFKPYQPHFESTWENLQQGEAELAEGKWEDALKHFDKALQQNPYHVRALRNQGLIYFHQGDIDKALLTWDRAFEVEWLK